MAVVDDGVDGNMMRYGWLMMANDGVMIANAWLIADEMVAD